MRPFMLALGLLATGVRGSPTLELSPSVISAGDWVTASWSGIPSRDLHANTSEYLCTQDSYCSEVQHLSAWVGVFPASAAVDPIGPQASWGCANPPWLSTAPIKWKSVNSSFGSARFRIEAARTDLRLVLFSNGTAFPIQMAASRPLTVRELAAPRHLHLALGLQLGQMRVMFESYSLDGGAMVRWGGHPGQYEHNESATPSTYTRQDLCGPPATTHGWQDPPWFYSSLLDVANQTTIYYSVGSDRMGWSAERRFAGPIPASSSRTLRISVLADVGETYVDGAQYHWMEPYAIDTFTGLLHARGTAGTTPLALSHPAGLQKTGKTSPPRGRNLHRLAQQAGSTDPGTDVVVHIGDLAYATGYESEWDYFMSQIEPIASQVPYMIGQGNHERDYPGSGNDIGGSDSGGECGVPTQARFVMPTPSHRQDQGWFSWEQGPVHFMMMDTEMSAANGSAQWNWMRSDMAAVNRSVTPWVIVMGHRPMYSSSDSAAGMDLANGPWWPDVEQLLVAFQVDLCLWGHVHNAEVTCPIIAGRCVQPSPGMYSAPVHAVVGNGGQSLSHWGMADPPEWSKFRLAEFGYSTIEVFGAEKLEMKFFADVVPKPNMLVHTLTLIGIPVSERSWT